MPSAKRERQRALRQQRRAALEAARRRRRARRNGIIGVLVVLAALGVIYLVTRGGPPKRKVAASCAAGPAPKTRVFHHPPAEVISTKKTYVAVVCTSVGTFEMDLAAKSAPRTVNDFVFLADHHFYDGLTFHRVLKGFVVQGGDPNPPTSRNPTLTGPQGPGYTVAGELPPSGKYPLWSVAMAKTTTQPAGTAGSQFFVVVGPAGEALPPDYALLGQVTSGFSVLRTIEDDHGGSPPAHPVVIKNVTIVVS